MFGDSFVVLVHRVRGIRAWLVLEETEQGQAAYMKAYREGLRGELNRARGSEKAAVDSRSAWQGEGESPLRGDGTG